MDKEYVENHLIFETVTGSRSYGINNPDSDYDKQGVMIPGLEYYIGNKIIEQYKEEGTDRTIFEFKKVVGLITENNPNCLDLLFPPDRCIVKTTPFWERIRENSELIISKKSRYTFSGYAINQLKRIETHRGYLLNPPKGKPERSDFGLKEFPIFDSAQLKAIINIESVFEYVLDGERNNFVNELDTVYAENVIPVFKRYLKKDRQEICLAYIQNTLHSQLNTLYILGRCGYIKDEYFEEAEKELKYQSKLNEWRQYEKWKKTRNEKRAELEKKFGFDSKHGAHLVRLLRMGAEILSTGKVNVDRTEIDAEELKAIRYDGIWTYDQIKEYAISMDSKLGELYKNSKLQKDPQRDKINDLAFDIIKEYFKIK